MNLFPICAADFLVRLLITALSPLIKAVIYTCLSDSPLHVLVAEVLLSSQHVKATTINLCPNPPFWITEPLWPFVCDVSKSCRQYLQSLAKL